MGLALARRETGADAGAYLSGLYALSVNSMMPPKDTRRSELCRINSVHASSFNGVGGRQGVEGREGTGNPRRRDHSRTQQGGKEARRNGLRGRNPSDEELL